MRISRASGPRASGPGCDRVVFHLAALRVAQQPGMNKTQMRHIQQVFDHARPQGLKAVRPGKDGAKSPVSSARETPADRIGLAQANPHHSVTFAHRNVSTRALAGGVMSGCDGNRTHCAGGRVLPGVIGANQAIAWAGFRRLKRLGTAPRGWIPAKAALRDGCTDRASSAVPPRPP
jgi:hypothetical protein